MFIANSINIDKNYYNENSNIEKKPGILPTLIVLLIGGGIIGSTIALANASNSKDDHQKPTKDNKDTIKTDNNDKNKNANNSELNTNIITPDNTTNEIQDEINDKNKNKNKKITLENNYKNTGSNTGSKNENDSKSVKNEVNTYTIQIDEKNNIHNKQKKDYDIISNGENIVKKPIITVDSNTSLDKTTILQEELHKNSILKAESNDNNKENIINGKTEKTTGYLDTVKKVAKTAAVVGGVGALYYLSTNDVVGGTIAGAGLAASYLYDNVKNMTTYKT